MLPPVPDYQNLQWTRSQQRGEDPPTRTDAIFLCIKGAFKLVGAVVCAIGFYLFARDGTSPVTALAIMLSGMLCAGFIWQAVHSIHRAVRILRGHEVD